LRGEGFCRKGKGITLAGLLPPQEKKLQDQTILRTKGEGNIRKQRAGEHGKQTESKKVKVYVATFVSVPGGGHLTDKIKKSHRGKFQARGTSPHNRKTETGSIDTQKTHRAPKRTTKTVS